jgi:hypothetical protein
MEEIRMKGRPLKRALKEMFWSEHPKIMDIQKRLL